MTDTTQTKKQNTALQIVIIGGLVVAAFLGAYKFASARTGSTTVGAGAGDAQALVTQASQNSATPADGSAPACACCGTGAPTENGVTGDPVEGTATVDGDVQTISVDVAGTYSPNIIKLKAGVPAEITFGQSSGCTAQIVSADLGFSEDLTAGPKVVKLPALEAGTYAFSCGMQMVFGQIVVE